MADNIDKDKDLIGESWVSSWENQCVEKLENESNMDERIHHENELSAQKLWLSFQNSASAISMLYKERCHQGVSLWVPFQNSASCVTLLYKESQDAMRKTFELGNQYGYQRRTRDILNWAKKRRHHIRREDLIGFLCGRNPPVRHHHHHRSSPTLSRTPSRGGVGDKSAPRMPGNNEVRENAEPDLQPFREALALQGLNGAMSNITVGRPGHGGTACPAEVGTGGPAGTHNEDLHYFILDEMARRCDARKRSPSTDIRLDSPSRKRSRLVYGEPDMDV